jgi:hypothetical protein
MESPRSVLKTAYPDCVSPINPVCQRGKWFTVTKCNSEKKYEVALQEGSPVNGKDFLVCE